MNRLRKTHLLFILFVLAITIVSCDEMKDNYEPYIESGEIFYTPRAQDLVTVSGYERIKFKWDVTSNKSITEWVISYGEITTIIPNDDLAAKEKEYILTGVEEGSHQFIIYSKSDTGNESIYTKVVAQIYGTEYSANLNSREIKRFSYDGVDGVIVFQSSIPSGRLTEVKFINSNNVEIVKTIDRDGTELKLENLSIESSILIRTHYLPTPPIEGVDTSLDEIASDWSQIQLPDFSTIMATTAVVSSLGGVTINWTNADAKEIRIIVTYTFDGNLISKTITTEVVDGEVVLPLLNNGAQDIVVSIADFFGNELSKTFNITPIAAVTISRNNWIVIDVSTEGYEGWTTDNMFDGDENSAWHSPWGGNSQYPHHFTVDMGAEITMSSIWIARKWDGRVNTKLQFSVSNDGINWEAVGTFINLDPTSNNPQHYGLATLPKARYFRVDLLEGSNTGDGVEAVVREFNVYGSEY